ncbi:tetratricopeptide repeat protein [SAR116 cluster bacterium]|nr:tetratricopeptide repeat protein [SAR116 cluster bacterium]
MSEEIISEIEEDLQKERFKKYWKNYGKYIYLLIMFIIFSVGGWQIYELLEKRRNIEASNIFLNILDVSKEDTEKAIEEIDKIKNLPNGYELLIKFQKANLHIKNNQISDAVLLFNQIHMDSSIDQNYRDIAFLLSIMHHYKQENSFAKLDNIISNNEHFAMLAKELKAYILYDNGKIKGAQNILEEILNSPNISQRSNERISNILKTFEKN